MSGELGSAGRQNCETAGFVAAAAPTGNYGIDVHIDTGALGLSSGGLLSTVQDLVVSPLWMALVWIAHALIVMLEWGFSIDLLDSSSAGTLGSALTSAQRSLTTPWLPLALAVAATLAAYHGLVRRKVAETLGEMLLMGVMLAGGMWLILDPTGSVGALGRWANQAGLGTLAVAVQGSPASPGRALGVAMGGVFQAAIEGPWCYLEFGNVSWCREQGRLDPRLRSAALKIAAQEAEGAGCAGQEMSCSSSDAGKQALLHSGRLLRQARTNGAIFLALPANGPARNSINDQGSLLSAICGSDQATSCKGTAAAEAEFRTDSGTWSRLGGLILIVAGALGMTMLLGYLALRLVLAAILSLFYLLLAPGMVLAPPFGESGRSLFRGWLTRLLGAVLSKLIFAFLLGVVLTVMEVLSGLSSLGWWTQWLLMSAFWWGVFLKRHQLALASGGTAAQRLRVKHRSVTGRMIDAVETPGRVAHAARIIRRQKPAPDATETQPSEPRDPSPSETEPDRQALALVRQEERRPGRGRSHDERKRDRDLAGSRAQLERIDRARAEAQSAGDGRRATRLSVRGERVRAQIERRSQSVEVECHRASEDGLKESSAYLDRQAELPSAGRADPSGMRRDYVALAALAGYDRAEFEQLDPQRRRAARLEIDRELDQRHERMLVDSAGSTEVRAPRGSEGTSAPRVPPHTGSDSPPRAGRPTTPRRPRESDVMRDARAVAEGRKRRLGFDQE
jgi:hypothetical protein